MIALFAVSTLTHTGQAIYHKTWFLLPTAVLCGCMEVLGWGARLWSHYQPLNSIPFQIQITCTIIAPTPLLAATFIIFGRLIDRLGSIYSRLTPKQYAFLFLGCDLISLSVQAVGGGLAATADKEKGENPEVGGHIMLGGIAFQLFAITVFCICSGEYIWRYLKKRPFHKTTAPGQTTRGSLTDKLTFMLAALTLSTFVLVIRSVYRTIELVDGWNGTIISTEWYFCVFDGSMIVIAIYLLNIVHPGIFLLAEDQDHMPEKYKLMSRSTLSI
ncbi:hypothetical protein D9611_012296 [Ephemerocybe angulata]|uniref:Uncharacterized protein n=1 Tax=Ephemerocybe angulata TaxID=980116 RepID=A0A8H5ATI0_9AGAR|nr:hypothetical protein D9611_012296 [Tulosesus angulatus]